MVLRKEEQRLDIRPHAHGGDGEVVLYHLADPEQTFKHCRLLCRTVLKPGCTMGYHVHEGEMEFFYVLKGTLAIDNKKEEELVYPGDVFVTAEGEGHTIRAHGDEDAEYLALVVVR